MIVDISAGDVREYGAIRRSSILGNVSFHFFSLEFNTGQNELINYITNIQTTFWDWDSFPYKLNSSILFHLSQSFDSILTITCQTRLVRKQTRTKHEPKIKLN